MKIRHIILGKANPNRMNGVNKVVNSLATNQSELGYDVGIWGITSDLEHNFPERNYATELFISIKNKLTISNDLMNACEGLDQDAVIHIHGGFIPEFYHVARKLNKLNIPYVYTPHGAYNKVAMQRSKFLKFFYFRIFDKYIAENAKAVHCIGQSEVDSTNDLSQKIRCALIPNGQEQDLDKGNTDIQKATNKIVFGFCGRVDVYTKGLDLLFDAFIKYRHDYNLDGQLWIIGDSDEVSGLRKYTKDNNLEDDIVFHGKQFGPEKNRIMADMDVFFHPSRNEGLPGAVLEAASLSVPCVVSKESNMSEYINQYCAGKGLAKNTVSEIALSMKEMKEKYDNKTISTLKKNALKMVQKEFDWKHISQRMIELYRA